MGRSLKWAEVGPKTGPPAKMYSGAIHLACGGAERWSRNGDNTRWPTSFGLRWTSARRFAGYRMHLRFRQASCGLVFGKLWQEVIPIKVSISGHRPLPIRTGRIRLDPLYLSRLVAQRLGLTITDSPPIYHFARSQQKPSQLAALCPSPGAPGQPHLMEKESLGDSQSSIRLLC